MVVIRGKTRVQRVGPADPLKLERYLGEIPVRAVAAVAADDLERAGVAAFDPSQHDPGRLAPQARRSAVTALASRRHSHGFPGLDAAPRIAGLAGAGHCGDGTRTVSRPDTCVRAQICATHLTP
jgi:hypothetical protein